MAHIVGNDIDFAAATLLVTDDLVGASKAAEVVDAFAKLTQLRTAQHKAAEELAAKGPRLVSTRVVWWRCGGHVGRARAVLRCGVAAFE